MPKLFRNSLMLISAAALVLLLMAGYVKLTQFEANRTDDLRLSVPEDIIWPWQQADLWIDYSGAQGQPVATVQPPGGLVFVIDTSGSMTAGDLNEARQAIAEMQLNVGNQGGLPPIAIVNFADMAKVELGFSQNPDELRRALSAMARDVGGGTRFIAGLDEALKVLQGRPDATVIMLTDGHAGESKEALRDYYRHTWQPQGYSLFMIGIGAGGVDTSYFQELTDDPSQFILAGLDRGAIGEHFVETARRLGNVLGRNGRIQLHLATPLWASTQPEEGELATRRYLTAIDSGDGSYFLPVLFKRSYEWAVRLDPEIGGILTTVAEAPQLTYVDEYGQTQEISGAVGPKILVITLWLLLLLLLPLLIYWLLALWYWLSRKAPKPLPGGITRRPNLGLPPVNLPLRPVVNQQYICWTPTLVIGLGGSGREVLTHLKQNLRDSLDEPDSRPVLLALDVARDEAPTGDTGDAGVHQTPGCLSSLDSQQRFILPVKSCDLSTLVHQSFDNDDPMSALDLSPYKNFTSDSLQLAKGTDGHRILARLALLNDLSAGHNSALLQRLQQALQQWRAIKPQQSARQIQIVANVDGGVGSGWLVDILILLRRLVADDQSNGQAVEIAVILQGQEKSQRGNVVGLNAPVLFAELDRLACAGQHKFRHQLSSDVGADASVPGLDGWVDSRPQDAVYIVPTTDAQQNPAVADVLSFLLDQRRRIEVAHSLQGMQGQEVAIRTEQHRECYTKVAVQQAIYPKSYFEQLQINRLQQLIISDQVLFTELEYQQDNIIFKATEITANVLLGMNETAEDNTSSNTSSNNNSTATYGLLVGNNISDSWPDSLAQVTSDLQQTRLLLLDSANKLLGERKLGLFGLQQWMNDFAQRLMQNSNALTGTELLDELASQLIGVADQAVEWINLLVGSDGTKANGLSPQQTAQGLLITAVIESEQTRQCLSQWSATSSRLLVNPAAEKGHRLANDSNENDIEAMLAQQFAQLLKRWLGDSPDQVAELSRRCYWQLIMPGLNGQDIGLQLVFRGTQTYRYQPQATDVARFKADLNEEAIRVLSQAEHSHILSLLQQHQKQGDEQWFRNFAKALKGGLSGEKSHLLVSVPTLHQSQSALGDFRAKLQKTFRDDVAGSTEIIRLHDSHDSARVSIFQAQPLMQAGQQPPGVTKTGHLPIHRPERLLAEYRKQLANELGLENVDLPAVTAIALAHQAGLREFAQLYFDGQVKLHSQTQQWQFNTGEGWQNLTTLAGATLVDAATCYAVDWQGQGNAERIQQSPTEVDAADHFIDLLAYLLKTTTNNQNQE
ncbi:MAG: hypothetical protein ACI8WB_003801 [Phenylobacterium sp.]|jgi:uncharacterized protein YegL